MEDFRRHSKTNITAGRQGDLIGNSQQQQSSSSSSSSISISVSSSPLSNQKCIRNQQCKSLTALAMLLLLVLFQMISFMPDLINYKVSITSSITYNDNDNKYNHIEDCDKTLADNNQGQFFHWFNNNNNNNNKIHTSSHKSLSQIYESILSANATNNNNNNNNNDNSNSNYLSSTHNDQYSWIGNHWIPPPNVPTYTPQQMIHFFQKHNTLFLGDSLARRSYASLFATLNHSSATTNNAKIIKADAIDHSSVIDINKRVVVEKSCAHLDYSNGTARGDIFPENKRAGHLCRRIPGATPDELYGKFDLIGTACFFEVPNVIKGDQEHDFEITKDYTLIVLQMGTWDMHSRRLCVKYGNGDPNLRVQTVDIIKSLFELQSPNRTVVWKTTGFDQRGGGGVPQTEQMNQNIIKQIEAFNENYPTTHNGQQSNLSYVDWSKVMFSRSFGKERIEGDIPVHYGLGARTLFAQMLLHHLLEREKQQKQQQQ